jgi:hypothetical protein
VKILFLTIIALVIPVFFLLIFVLGTYNRLAALRNRCRTGATGPDPDGVAERQRQAVEQYNAARRSFPASLVARLFGFGPEQLAVHGTPIMPGSSRASER